MVNLNAKQQLEEFDEWLEAKYREVLNDWNETLKRGTPSAEAVRAKYDELLRTICVEIKWVERTEKNEQVRRQANHS